MIKQDLSVTVNSYTLDGEIIVPSAVLTSTPQEEVLDLTKTPNFTLKINDTYSYMNIKDTVMVEFSTDSYNYSSYMNVINTTNGTVTLQYVDGLTAEDVSDDSSDEPSQSNEYITFTTSQGTFVVWSNSGMETETVTFIDSDIYDTDWYCIGTWKYYIDDVEVIFDYGEGICSSEGNNPTPFRLQGIVIYDTDWQTGEVQTQTGEIGYLHWLEDDTRELTILDDNVSINLQHIAAEPEPKPELHFSSPEDGSTITGALDYELQEFKYPIEVVGADGNNISYDITAISVTCDNQDVAVGYTEDADENEQSYISGVYIYIYQVGTGTATLTFTDPESGDTCTSTFTYDISDDSSDDSSDETTLDKYLDVECSLSSNSKSMALPQGNNNNLQTDIYAAVYLVDPNTVVGEGTKNEHYYTKVVISQDTLDNMHGMEETLEQLGWWGTKPYDDYLIVPSINDDVILIDSNGNNFITGTDAWGDNYKGIWRFNQLGAMQATIFDAHGMRLYLTDEGPYTKTFDLATPYLRVMRNGSQDNSGTFYGTVDQNTNETVWSDYLIYPVYDDMYGGIWNASNGSDFLGQYNNGGTFVGQYLSGDPHGYPFNNNLGAFMLEPPVFEDQDPQEVLIEWRRSDPTNAPEYYEGIDNEYPYKVLYSQTYNFTLQVPE